MINYERVVDYVKANWASDVATNGKIANDLLKNTFIFNMPWDMEATHEPVSFDDKIDWLYKPTADMEFTWQFNRHRFLINLGQQYWLSGNKSYADKFIYLVNDWIDNVKLVDDVTRNNAWRSLEVGLRAATWIHAIKYIDSYITPDFRAKFCASLAEHRDYLLATQRDYHSLSNWGAIQNHGLFAIAAYLGERDIMAGSLKVAYDRIIKQMETQIMPDGMQWEQSPMYHTEVLICYSDVMVFAREYTIALPEQFVAVVRKMAHVLLKWIKPNGKQPNCGDSDYTDLGGLLAKMTVLLGDSTLKFKATPCLDYESAWTFGEQGIATYDAISAQSPDYTNAWLPDSGHYFMRSDWGSKANYLHFVNGYTGGGHAHCDKLHVDITAHGKDILIDSGRFTYYKGDRRRYQLKSQRWHNTIGLNGKSFMINQAGGWSFIKKAIAIKGDVIDNEAYTYIHGAHKGYLANGGMVERHILWLKPDIYILWDSFSSRGLSSYQRYFNFAPEVDVKLSDRVITATNDGVVAKIHFTDKVSLKVKPSMLSYQYNKMINNIRVEENSHGIGNADRIAVVDCSGMCKVERGRIYNENRACSADAGASLTITCGDDIYEIVFCFVETLCYVSNNKSCGGAGRIIISKNGEKSGVIW